MKSKLFRYGLILIYILLTRTAVAQKRNNIWLFGNEAGVDFNQNPPATFKGTPMKVHIPQFTSSICDTTGALLFYSDGADVWNKNNHKLPKKNNWWPWYLYTMPLLIQHPKYDSVYLLFGVSNYDYTLKVLALNSYGIGDIFYPPGSTFYNYYRTLLKGASVMVAGTNHCNKKDIWIVAHSASSFYSFLLSDRGIDSNAVVSNFNSENLPPGKYETSNLKFSANGERMIMPLISENKIAVFDFDNLTGKLSKPLLLSLPSGFTIGDGDISPDATKLYVDGSYFDEEVKLHRIYQMDLQAGAVEAIQNSMVSMSPYPDRAFRLSVTRSLQLAPNGKIYVTIHDKAWKANVIEEPNQQGTAATYNVNKLDFKTAFESLNYNYLRSESYSPKTSGINVRHNNCLDQPVHFSLLFHNADSVLWTFGDTVSNNSNFSKSLAPDHLYPGPGTFVVSAIIYHKCFIDTASTIVTLADEKAVRLPAFLKDTVICIGDQPVYNITTPGAEKYFWSDDGFTGAIRKITTKGTYEVRAQNACSIDVRKFTVATEKCDCRVFVPSAFTPNKDGLNDIFKPVVRCFVNNYRFQIFSRLGNVIYSATDAAEGWDGNMGDVGAESGTYIWVVSYLDPGTDKSFNLHGTVSLIR